jgi:hypothetical protein
VYYSRFALTSFIVLLAIVWVLGGCYGARRLLQERRQWWLLSLALLLGWVFLSVGWAQVNPAVAKSQAMQWGLMAVFVLIVSAVNIRPSWVIIALLVGIIFQAGLALGQVARQEEIGLSQVDTQWLKIGLGLAEFDLDPAESGISVVQSNGARFLRPYGLTPHSNLLAAAVVLGWVVGLSLLAQFGEVRIWFWGIFALLFWTLLLSFSRAALGGAAVGLGTWLTLGWRRGWLTRQTWPVLMRIILSMVIIGAVFFLMYHELILARAGLADQSSPVDIEARSLSDRRVYTDQAITMIETHPVRGVGIGNFPWVSGQLLRADSRQMDLRGDHVHNTYLLILSETGVVGGGLFALNGLIAAWIFWQNWRQKRLGWPQIGLIAGIVSWLAISVFEFFIWVLFTHQILFWGVLAVALIPEKNTVQSFTA